MNILGIETSCDETAAAIVRNGRGVLSNVVFSQVPHHREFGGVVPEVASRLHVEHLPGVVEDALRQAELPWDAVDAIAVTRGPGLATSLLVGLSAAKALALRLKRSLIPVNHIEAHVHSVFLGENAPEPPEVMPLLALIVSGGHTSLLRVEQPRRYRLISRTVDDAAGEAFDKGSSLLGLGYPGGPAIERAARTANGPWIRFPLGAQKHPHQRLAGLDHRLCFSFSGLKTALLHHLKSHPNPNPFEIATLAASYQETIVNSLLRRVKAALPGHRALAIVGGVSLNGRLREQARVLADQSGVRLLLPAPAFCTDNAAMVAGVAYGLPMIPPDDPASLGLDVEPGLLIGTG